MNLSRRLLLTGGVAALTTAAAPPPRFDACVGKGGYASVAAAIDAAPANAGRPWRIKVDAGVWKEKLTIAKPWIELIGDGIDRTVLTFDQAAGMRDTDGKPWGTFRSASVTILAPHCTLRNLTVANAFDYVAARRSPADNPAGNGLQAVALATNGASDHFRVDRVKLSGWQDTLLVNAGRSHFTDCIIEGAVDYIFGAGIAHFERCRIVSRFRDGMQGRAGYITAPSTPADQPYGLVFRQCRLERDGPISDGSYALGRPWRPRANAVGQSVFIDCWMDAHIDPAGWDRMAYGRNPDGSYKWFEPEEARFFEYRSRGPGAHGSPRRRQLDRTAARRFTRARIFA